ncbi:hypothetical protein HN415_00265 [Candidatus Woesearchaeota archaeon]|nr:hypothetical protein [Candidatus Woesearchaeota archaeon]
MNDFIIPEITFQNNIYSLIFLGFTLSIFLSIIQKINIKHKTIPWVSLILGIILIVGNLQSIDILPIKNIINNQINSTEIIEKNQACPTALNGILDRPLSEIFIQPDSVKSSLNKMVNTSIWRIEGDIRTCYKGKYKGQYPNWYYCDDMIVSRWETSKSGLIKYRWYTAVTSEWKSTDETGTTLYTFEHFSCENGKKVTVNKETTAYYVHVSRDGTEIKIKY